MELVSDRGGRGQNREEEVEAQGLLYLPLCLSLYWIVFLLKNGISRRRGRAHNLLIS